MGGSSSILLSCSNISWLPSSTTTNIKAPWEVTILGKENFLREKAGGLCEAINKPKLDAMTFSLQNP